MNEHLQAWLDAAPLGEIFTSSAFLYFAVGLAVVLLAKPIKGLTTRYHLSEELTGNDNKAVGVATAGYIFGVLTIIRGVLISGGNSDHTIWQELLSIAVWTAISLALLLSSAWINRKHLLTRHLTSPATAALQAKPPGQSTPTVRARTAAEDREPPDDNLR